jgi:hypothetical protein
MNEPSDRDPYEEQIRRLRRILGPQFRQFRQFERLHAPVIRAMLGNDFMRRNNELMRLITGSAARSAVSPLFARNEELLKALTAGARTVRLFDPKAMETFRLLNPPSFTSAFSKFAAPGITEAMRGFHDFRHPLITEQLKPLLERFRETWERSLPPNWDGRDDPDEVETLVEFMEETGWCLVWTPRWSVIEALLAATSEARADVLHEHEEEILADLESCLAEVDQPEVEELQAASAEAIQAYRNETVIPAQTAATAVLTTAIHVHFGIPTFPKAREKFGEKKAMEASIQQFRLRAILRVAYHAIAEFHGKAGETMPVKFNRHASVHRVSRAQHNRTNALVALMLVVPLVRELDRWFASRAAEEADAA